MNSDSRHFHLSKKQRDELAQIPLPEGVIGYNPPIHITKATNSDNVEAILAKHFYWRMLDGKKVTHLDQKEAKVALDRHYASKFLELALEVCKNQPITFNRLERAVKEHFNG